MFKLERLMLLSSHSPTLHAFADQRGLTYLTVMYAIVLMGISLAAVGQNWQVIAKRDAEAELYFRGTRIKQAIEAYAADYEVRKGTRSNRYPLSLKQLTEGPKRYLPVVYHDPITRQDFELGRVNGEIRGVRSRSMEMPLDRVRFKGAATYSQIAFQAEPPSSPGPPCAMGSHPINPLNPLLAEPCPPAPPAPLP